MGMESHKAKTAATAIINRPATWIRPTTKILQDLRKTRTKDGTHVCCEGVGSWFIE